MMPDALCTALTNNNPDSCVDAHTSRSGKPWRLSKAGYTFIAVLESGIVNGTYQGKRIVDGFIVKVYDDGFGIPTVGLGHRVNPADNLRLGDVISVERARRFFSDNVQPIEAAINRDVMVPLYQHEYDALVSVLFNTGPFSRPADPWSPKTRCKYLADFLNRGEYDRMRDVIRSFIPQRVPWRRRLEAQLFVTGIYDARH